MVLDLRNDPGGLLDSAGRDLGGLPAGERDVVSTNGQLPESKFVYKAAPEFYQRRAGSDPLKRLPPQLKNVPLVVLVNEGSASASEIVAGALQDHKRATSWAARPSARAPCRRCARWVPDTGLKLTTARYYTPSGKSIQAQRHRARRAGDETAEGNIFAALRTREADLDKHLSSGQNTPRSPRIRASRRPARKHASAPRKRQEGPGRSQGSRVRQRQGLPAGAGPEPAEGPAGGDLQDPGRGEQGREEGKLSFFTTKRAAQGPLFSLWV
jgi:carboxyl-terminal processing protease